MEPRNYLDSRAIVAVIILTLLWGFNHAAIKYSNQGISPVFACALRSAIASMCGIAYCLWKQQRIFHTDIVLFHGFVIGLLFGLEFACIYVGLLYTDAARSAVFVYLMPFLTAAGAHFFLKNDRLTIIKVIGLVLAFSGIVSIFGGRPAQAKSTMWVGDTLAIMAAVGWAATTLYIKRFLAERIEPINTFLYQLVFSIPVLFVMSFVLESQWMYRVDLYIVAAIVYQSIIVAFLSYFAWFKLIHAYPVSKLSAFVFLAPVFGVISGTLFLREEFTLSLLVGLPLVCIGIFVVNWRRGVGNG